MFFVVVVAAAIVIVVLYLCVYMYIWYDCLSDAKSQHELFSYIFLVLLLFWADVDDDVVGDVFVLLLLESSVH